MTTVKIFNNGPISMEGDFTITDQNGDVYDVKGRTKIGLCRCGKSSNKPFCDGTHGREGFSSECKAFALPEKKA